VNSIIVFVAEYFLYLGVILTALFWLRCDRTTKIELVVRLVIGGVLAIALSILGAHLYYDTRPFVTEHVKPLFAHAADNGFPSDHALLTSFLGFTVLMYSRKVGVILLGIAVAVGAARVAAHVHAPVDIAGSFVISALSALVVERVAMLARRRTMWGRHVPEHE
jgi:undecaprenyl-diphosphatase